MASIDKRPDGRYRTRWREYPGGPKKTRHFDRKVDAQQFLDGIRGDLAHGLYVDPEGGRTLFRTYAEEWRSCQVHHPSTAAQAETYLRLHAYPALGNRPMGAIRRSEVQAWVKALSTRLAPGSVEVVYRGCLPVGVDDLQGGRRRPPDRCFTLYPDRSAEARRHGGRAARRRRGRGASRYRP